MSTLLVNKSKLRPSKSRKSTPPLLDNKVFFFWILKKNKKNQHITKNIGR